MNTIYIQNKTGFDNNNDAVFIVNDREYRKREDGMPTVIEIPAGVSKVRIQMKCRRLASPIYEFDLKNGRRFTVRCTPLLGLNADNNLKLLVSVYILLMILAAYTGYIKTLYTLLLICILTIVYFLTVGRGKFFIILQETEEIP